MKVRCICATEIFSRRLSKRSISSQSYSSTFSVCNKLVRPQRSIKDRASSTITLYSLQSQQEASKTSVTVNRNSQVFRRWRGTDEWRHPTPGVVVRPRSAARRGGRFRNQLSCDVRCIVGRRQTGSRNQHGGSRVMRHGDAANCCRDIIFERVEVDLDLLWVFRSTSYLSGKCFVLSRNSYSGLSSGYRIIDVCGMSRNENWNEIISEKKH